MPADRFLYRRLERVEADVRKLAAQVHEMQTDDLVAERVAAELRKAQTRGWTRRERGFAGVTLVLLVVSTGVQVAQVVTNR